MIAERRARFAGVDTRVLAAEGVGAPIVLLHGFADSAETWSGLLAEFERTGRAAIAVDLPGFGTTARRVPGEIMPPLDTFVDAVVAELGPVVLIGNSLGACLSVRAAARGSSNIRAVVAVDEPILASHLLMRVVRAERDLLRLLDIPIRLPKRLFDAVVRRVFALLLYYDRRSADPAVLARFTSQVPDLPAAHRMLCDARAVAVETAAGYDTKSVRCPLLVIHGRKDRIIPVHASERLHRSVPGSTLVVLPRGGHCPQLDDPALLAEHVQRYLDSTAGG